MTSEMQEVLDDRLNVRSTDRRFTRRRLVEIGLIVLVEVLAAVPSLETSTRMNFDSGSYFHSPFSLYRLPVVPAFYWVLGHNLKAITVSQCIAGALCWGYLALVSLSVTRRPYCYIATTAVLFVSCTDYVTHWYTAILSDSLSLSFLALLLASLASWLGSRGSLARLVIVALLWAGTRDTNGYVVLIYGIVALIITLVRNRRPSRIVASALAIVGGGSILADAEAGGIWQQPFQHVLTERILSDQQKIGWFKSHGMPVTPTLLHISGSWTLASQNVLVHSPKLAPFRAWMQHSGERTYILYVLLHPWWALRGTFGRQQEFDEALIRYYGGTPAHPWVPQFLREAFLVGPQTTILIATAIAVAVAVARHRAILSRMRIVAVWWASVLITGYLGLIFDWVGDSWEVGRHSVTAVAQIWVGAAFLTAVALGASTTPRGDDPGRHMRSAAP